MKTCSECKKDYPALWKAKTKAHGAMCKYCWNRYKGIQKPLKPNKSTIKQVSDKRSKELAEYRKLRDVYMIVNPICEVRGCSRRATDLHHKVSREFALLDMDVFMAVCRACHNKFEEEDEWARKNGYKLSKHKYNLKRKELKNDS